MTSQAQPVLIDCPAKVNLNLSIGAPLPSGMHPIASWMVCLEFCDQLTLGPALLGESVYEMTYGANAPKPCPIDWPLEKDLGFRAHKLLEELAGRTLPVHYRLEKNIPTGAGLGGGSSNAAATLVGINKAFSLGLSTQELIEVGRKLGSDVGFLVGALADQATSAIVLGLGEKLEPAPLKQTVHLVLIFPPFGCPTGPVYGAFDRLHNYKKESCAIVPADEARVIAMTQLTPLPDDSPFNDLAEPACMVAPGMRDSIARATTALGRPVHVTGSGSTLFTIAQNEADAQALAQRARELTGMPAISTKTR